MAFILGTWFVKHMSIFWTKKKHKIMKYKGILWKRDNTVSEKCI